MGCSQSARGSPLVPAPKVPDTGRRMSSPAAGTPVSDFVARRRRAAYDTDPTVARKRLALIVVLAVLMRILAWSGTVQMAGDGPDSLWQAQRLQAGDIAGALSHPDPPLYALAVVAASFLTGQLVLAAVLVSIVSGVIIVFAVHGLTRLALPGRRDVACGAATLAAIYTPVVIATGNVTSDGLFLALFLVALRLFFAGEQSGQLRLRLFEIARPAQDLAHRRSLATGEHARVRTEHGLQQRRARARHADDEQRRSARMAGVPGPAERIEPGQFLVELARLARRCRLAGRHAEHQPVGPRWERHLWRIRVPRPAPGRTAARQNDRERGESRAPGSDQLRCRTAHRSERHVVAREVVREGEDEHDEQEEQRR